MPTISPSIIPSQFSVNNTEGVEKNSTSIEHKSGGEVAIVGENCKNTRAFDNALQGINEIF